VEVCMERPARKIIYAFENINMVPALNRLNRMGIPTEVVSRRMLRVKGQYTRYASSILSDLGIENLYVKG